MSDAMEDRALATNRMQLAVFAATRAALASALGQTAYGGDRDYYDALGYPKTIQFKDYLAYYARDAVAGAVVDLPADDTWRKPPLVSEGGNMDTPFVQAWEALAERLRAWSYLARVDRLSGIGQYGVLLIGVKDGEDLGIPAKAGSLTGIEDVLYLRAMSEGSASISASDNEQASRRYGLPETYSVDLGDSAGTTKPVHFSRVIHVADNKFDSEVYGTPRQEPIFNLLLDLCKLIGGSAEATWLGMRPGTIIRPQPDYNLDTDDSSLMDDIEAELQEYAHDPLRFLRLVGMEAQQLAAGEVIDPAGPVDKVISLIAARTRIPQRVLLGSAAGELASAQEDMKQWAGTIQSRQTNYAEPEILRPFIDRLVWLGAIPVPVNGYEIGTPDAEGNLRWPSILQTNAVEEADVTGKKATAARQLADPFTGQLPLTEDETRELLGYPPLEDETVSGLVAHDKEAMYARGIRSAIRAVWKGIHDYFDFYDAMSATINIGLRQAWKEGAAMVGISEDELTAEEIATRDGIIAKEQDYITGFFDFLEGKIKASGGLLRESIGAPRAKSWTRRYTDVRSQAMMTGRDNPKLKWLLGATKEHCEDCLTYSKRIYRASTWKKYDIRPKHSGLACGGGRGGCDCDFESTDDPATRGRPPGMRGK